jgi:hypothetical protein
MRRKKQKRQKRRDILARQGRLWRRQWRCVALILSVALAACDGTPGESPWDAVRTLPHGRFHQISSYDTTGGNRDRLEIAAGDSAVLMDVDGPGVIRRIWITVFSRDPHYLRRIALEMYWDGEIDPSVAVPLGDFFGNGFDKRHYVAAPMGVSSGGFYCYLVMPFQERARIVVRNGTGRAIDAFYHQIGYEALDLLPRNVPTLHAVWHRDPRTDHSRPHRVLEARGRGAFVGVLFNAESYRNSLVFLEGDELFYVDGEFRGQGTGTEDYFNSGWYFDQGPFAAPYHGLVLKDDQRGRIAAYRWQLPDPVTFNDSIRIELEHGHANEDVADYATTAFWYQVEPHAPLPPLPPPGERRVLDVKIAVGAVLREHLLIDSAPAGVTVAAPVPRADRYEVWLYPMGRPSGGTVTVGLAGARGRALRVAAAERATILAPVSLGTAAVRDTIRVVIAGGTADVAAAIDARPVRRWANEWNVVGPFPNPQRLGTEYSPALDSAWAPERNPDLVATYTHPDGGAARWQRVRAGNNGYVSLNPHFQPNDWVAAYAQAFLYSPDERGAVLLLGADDGHVLWVNGERVSTRQGRNISRADDLAVPVRLERGWNRVLLKVADLDGGWAFQMRVADPEGVLLWSADLP